MLFLDAFTITESVDEHCTKVRVGVLQGPEATLEDVQRSEGSAAYQDDSVNGGNIDF